MKRFRFVRALLQGGAAAFVLSYLLSTLVADEAVPKEQVPVTDTITAPFVTDFIENHCMDCHDGASSKGDLNLEDLGPVNETNAEVWKSIWAQVSIHQMPPKKKKQPEVVDRLQFSNWIVSELQRAMKGEGGFHAHLDPKKGNFVHHDLLFGKLPKDVKLIPTSSPARIWRITPQEHITRLNELINSEPSYDPAKPGLRAHGDSVPTNHGGELKLYFGTDRIIKWHGLHVAYGTAVKSVPVVLSSSHTHGFENYADFHSVNSAESTQILAKAGDLLRYMAYGPLSIANPEQITDDPKTYRPKGDIRGLPTSLTYSTKVMRPLTPVYDLMEQKEMTASGLKAAVDYLFEALTFRPATDEESSNYQEIVEESIARLGKEKGLFMGLSSIFLHRDALFRPELVESGKADEHGRVMLQDWELGLAINHALRYLKPDQPLKDAIVEGRMRTRDDVRREVARMLEDDSLRKPRILRFFREYFDYDLAGSVCKDAKALQRTGVPNRNDQPHYRAMFDAKASTDRLVEHILEEDKNVLKELLTTQKVVAGGADPIYFGSQRPPEERKKIASAMKVSLPAMEKEYEETLAALGPAALKRSAALNDHESVSHLSENEKKALSAKWKELDQHRVSLEFKMQRARLEIQIDRSKSKLPGDRIFARVSRRSFGGFSLKPERRLSEAPKGQRLGILTHPSWLISHSDAMDNHAIHRGIWIRERLLGGGIPDVPITVDAMLPDEPESTLRHRMRVTREKYCWTCHQKIDPLGLPFEMYNHAGVFRTTEQDKPVDTTGEIVDSGDPNLDGPVANAIEMIRKLAKSERVEQVFVRHAFRFWMGRNETIHDAPVLQEAHKAYRESGGSMKALILSLVTSDAFLYRARMGQ